MDDGIKAAPKRKGGQITEATRRGLEAALDGMTARQKGAEKAGIALDWLYRWGWSTSSLIGDRVGTGRKNTLGARLVKNGWARRQPIRIVSSFRSVPHDILTITPEGVSELIALRGELPHSLGNTIGGSVLKKNVVHDLLAQRLTLQYMGLLPGRVHSEFVEEHGKVIDFSSDRQLGEVTRGVKRADAYWEMESGYRFAVEVERSPKFGKELDQFIAGHVHLQHEDTSIASGGVHGVVTFFLSKDTLKRYNAAMQPGTTVKEWLWDAKQRTWYDLPNATIEIPEDFWAFFLPIIDP